VDCAETIPSSASWSNLEARAQTVVPVVTDADPLRQLAHDRQTICAIAGSEARLRRHQAGLENPTAPASRAGDHAAGAPFPRVAPPCHVAIHE
jgi:hypothetical protein